MAKPHTVTFARSLQAAHARRVRFRRRLIILAVLYIACTVFFAVHG